MGRKSAPREECNDVLISSNKEDPYGGRMLKAAEELGNRALLAECGGGAVVKTHPRDTKDYQLQQ